MSSSTNNVLNSVRILQNLLGYEPVNINIPGERGMLKIIVGKKYIILDEIGFFLEHELARFIDTAESLKIIEKLKLVIDRINNTKGYNEIHIDISI